ncbi:MAG: inositol monophosphatase family protein [Candidatus Woesearchaeota archaeon]
MDFEKIFAEAAELITNTESEKTGKFWYKENDTSASSIVTETDVAIEKELIRYFNEKMPDYSILSEESGFQNRGYDKVIVIDPLDCTKGFHEGKGNYGSFIAIYEKGICIAGMDLHIPSRQFLMGSSEIKSTIEKEKTGFFYAEIPERTKNREELINRLNELGMPIKSEAHVLNKAYTFLGKYEGLLHSCWSYHDLAAAPLFGRLTGYKVTDAKGQEFEPLDFKRVSGMYPNNAYSVPVVIARPELHEKVINAIKDFF